MPRSHRPLRPLRTFGAAALAAGALLAATGAPAAAAPTADGNEALAWLADELEGADGVFVYDGGFGDFTDYGLTLDAVIALALGGTGTDAIADAWSVFATDASTYITGDTTTDHFAGAAAKVLLARQLTGQSTTVDGIALETELRNRIDATATATKGRFRDVSAFGDFSNGFSQGLGVLALSRTTGGVPADVLAFLLDQQCPGGGFRVAYDLDADVDGVADAGSTPGCEAAAESDPDATALALQALLAVPSSTAVTSARSAAVGYLEAAVASLPNANSAGLAGQALRAAGRTAVADGLATKVAALQFPSGAIALDTAAFTAGQAASTPQALWRSTAQGVLALGLGPLAPLADPPPTTTTTTVATTTTTAASSTSSSSSTSTTIAATTTTAKGGSLPRTGSSVRDEVALALLLLGAGAVVTGQVMVRERPAK